MRLVRQLRCTSCHSRIACFLRQIKIVLRCQFGLVPLHGNIAQQEFVEQGTSQLNVGQIGRGSLDYLFQIGIASGRRHIGYGLLRRARTSRQQANQRENGVMFGVVHHIELTHGCFALVFSVSSCFHQRPPSAWNKATVSPSRLACACARLMVARCSLCCATRKVGKSTAPAS